MRPVAYPVGHTRSLGRRVTENQRGILGRLRELEDVKVLLEGARGHARSIDGTDGERIGAEIKRLFPRRIVLNGR